MNYSKVIMRVGPGMLYPVNFVYKMKNLPMHIISRFEDWIQVCDMDGDCGWVLRRMLTKQRFIITLSEITGRKDPFPEALIVAKIGNHALLRVINCKEGWCLVSVQKRSFWVSSNAVWGCK